MEKSEIIDKLSSLLKLDVDAVQSYEKTLEKIDEKDLYDQIALFRDDHVRHVDDLSAVIEKLSGTPPERTPDIRGYFLKGATMLQNLMGTE